MTGKVTRASVEAFAQQEGLEPIQIDGIPEGFSFKESDVKIGNSVHPGRFTAFIPLKRWEDEISQVWGLSEEGLLKVYREYSNGK